MPSNQQGSSSQQLEEAMALQIELQKRLHEQLEVRARRLAALWSRSRRICIVAWCGVCAGTCSCAVVCGTQPSLTRAA